MRVLYIIPNLGSGGAEKMLVDLVREMLNKNVECEVAVLTKSDNFFGKELEVLNIPIYYGSSPKVYAFQNLFFLRRILKAYEYDCIHTHLFGPQLFAPLITKTISKKFQLVTTEHSTHNKRRDNKLFYLLDYWIYKQYKKVIAITDDTKDQLVKYLPSIKNKVEVIGNGIDENIYADAKPLTKEQISPLLKNGAKLILMVAGMREQKDQETLIRASKHLPDNYCVIFVGEGPRMQEVQKYAKEIGQGNILFLGSRKDVPSLMKSADVFVLSSKWEGFGLVVVEAAAAGLPVVASNVDGLREVVQRIGGKLFEPSNELELSELIVSSINEEIAVPNVSPFSIKNTAQKYIKLYEDVVK